MRLVARPLRSPVVLIAGLATVLAGAGCGSASDGDAADRIPSTRATTTSGAGAVATSTAGVRLAAVHGGMGDALYITGAPGQPGRLFVVQQSGRIRILEKGRFLSRPFLDLSRSILSGGERGLLGLAFHPDYASNGRFYVDYTNRSGDTRVVEYRRQTAVRANPASARVLLGFDQPFANHNGGALQFGPDGRLYISSGDGGSGGDPSNNGQRTDTLLGKLLRIDVDARTGGLPYGIPSDNPFASGGGRPEIYHYGLRNPWRFSFDRQRGDLWIGDVGQGNAEEVDYRPRGAAAGANFGWRAFEGRSAFSGGANALKSGSTHVPPVAQYTHAKGCSITGGYVYRGTRAPALAGRYVYADFCSGQVWSLRGGPTAGGSAREENGLGVSLSNVTSFGESLNGDLYVLANGSLYRFARR